MPGEPSISNIGAKSVTVSWTPPSSDEGSPITGYIVKRADRFSTRWVPINTQPTKDTRMEVIPFNEHADSLGTRLSAH